MIYNILISLFKKYQKIIQNRYGNKLHVDSCCNACTVCSGCFVVFATFVWKTMDAVYGGDTDVKRADAENAKRNDAILRTSIFLDSLLNVFISKPCGLYAI